MVTSQRTSIAAHNIDMCSLLNRNQEHVDICQCAKIKPEDIADHILTNVVADLSESIDVEVAEVIAQCFSSANLRDIE